MPSSLHVQPADQSGTVLIACGAVGIFHGEGCPGDTDFVCNEMLVLPGAPAEQMQCSQAPVHAAHPEVFCCHKLYLV